MDFLKETTKDVAQEVIAILGTALMSLMLWVVIAIK